MKRGCFITLEGVEGVGKSSNLVFLHDSLKQRGVDVWVTREPGGTELGEEIRQLLLGHRHDGMSDETELLLMFAARAEHLGKEIRPRLQAGQWVLCDRFTDATYAYQGGGRGIPESRIAPLEQWVQGDLRPDVTILLDAPLSVAFSRVNQRGATQDRFEKQKEAFFTQVRQCYLDRAAREPNRFRVVDASRTLNEVQLDLSVLTKLVLDEFL